jgi:hypothetical protein
VEQIAAISSRFVLWKSNGAQFYVANKVLVDEAQIELLIEVDAIAAAAD